MQTTSNEGRGSGNIRCTSDGSVAGTRFYNDQSGEQIDLIDVTVQQEGMSEVRIRFAPSYGVGSFVMGADDTHIVNRTAHE